MIYKVLVVDDEKIMLDLLEKILEKNRYNVTSTVDGEEAIKILVYEDFDLVITDLQLGQVNGFDILRKAKALNPRTVVIMITGCSEREYAIEAHRLGVDSYLLKPISATDLLQQIQLQEIKLGYLQVLTLQQKQNAAQVNE
ncbi:MAG: response regulator [Bacteroidetes bacterium]|nr:response regulator [Bacteroidota bacterium]